MHIKAFGDRALPGPTGETYRGTQTAGFKGAASRQEMEGRKGQKRGVDEVNREISGCSTSCVQQSIDVCTPAFAISVVGPFLWAARRPGTRYQTTFQIRHVNLTVFAGT